MKKYKILCLTDARTHRPTASVYPLLESVNMHDQLDFVDVATIDHPKNYSFFYEMQLTALHVFRVGDRFDYSRKADLYSKTNLAEISNYDFIFFRLPPPVSSAFMDFLAHIFPPDRIINNPNAIREVGSKLFLLKLKSCCPKLKLCSSIEDITTFKQKGPIVLKPLDGYGGKGICKIEGGMVWEDNQSMRFEDWAKCLQQRGSFSYLAMEYLHKVDQGDKRILVVNGKIIGAILRLPPKGSWLCNISQGGSAQFSIADENEVEIAKTINQKIEGKGILIYGFDTLMGNDGKRVLSEINAFSPGGLSDILKNSPEDLKQQLSKEIFVYLDKLFAKALPVL